MKRSLACFFCFLLAGQAFNVSLAAIQSSVIWETQSGGNDANGGGFDSALAGTDAAGTPVSYTDITTSSTGTGIASGTYTSGITATGASGQTCVLQSFNNSSSGAMVTVALTGSNTIAGGTSLVVIRAGNSATSAPTSATAGNGTATCSGTATVSTTLGVAEATSSGHAFSSTTNGPGNIINITSGTNCVTGRAEIISVSGSTATFDHVIQTASVGTPATCSGTLGGYFAGVAAMTAAYVPGNIGYVKNGIASISTGFTWSVVCNNTTLSIPVGGQCQLIGYSATRGDNGQATITNTGSIATIMTDSGAWHVYRNITVDAGGAGKGQTILNDSTGTPLLITNSVFKNFITRGVNAQTNGLFMRNVRITGGSSCTAGFTSQGRNVVYGSEIDNNACPAITTASTGGLVLLQSLIHDNSGATSDGVQIGVAAVGSAPQLIQGNVFYNNGRDHLRAGLINGFDNTLIYNNIFMSSGASATGYAIDNTVNSYAAQTGFPSPISANYNAFLFNGGDTGTTTTHNLNGFSYGANDFCANTANGCATTLTADPFTSKGTGDFSLNSTANAGAALRGAAFPGTFPAGNSVGHLDVGAVQTAAGGGGGTGQISYGFAQ